MSLSTKQLIFTIFEKCFVSILTINIETYTAEIQTNCKLSEAFALKLGSGIFHNGESYILYAMAEQSQ